MSLPTSMSRALRNQVEKINDEAGDAQNPERREVIVRMEKDEKQVAKILDAGRDAIARRRVSVQARSMLPPERDKLETQTKRTLRKKNPQSVAAQLAVHAEVVKTRTLIQQVAMSALEPLLGGALAKYSIESLGRLTKAVKSSTSAKTDRSPKPNVLWTSSSAGMIVTREQLEEIARLPGVAGIYPNRRVQLPPIVRVEELPPAVADNHATAWGITKTGAAAVWGAYGAYGAITDEAGEIVDRVKVAVLDTGVDASHPDLADKVLAFREFAADGSDATRDVTTSYDTGSHGTHVAGTIVGGDASGRWIGMAPDARVLSGVVLPDGSGTDFQILAGIEWAIENDADIINMSLGGLRFAAEVFDTYTRSVITANQLGIPVVAAIGNDGNQTSGSPGNDYFIFSVGATNHEDRAAGFSAGRTQAIYESRYISEEHLPLVYSKPDVSAPGVDVYSSVPGGAWEAWNGTSMATPHTAGALALLLSATSIREASPAQERAYLLQDLIVGSVDDLGEAGQDHRYGYGRIDVLKAVGFAWERGYGA